MPALQACVTRELGTRAGGPATDANKLSRSGCSVQCLAAGGEQRGRMDCHPATMALYDFVDEGFQLTLGQRANLGGLKHSERVFLGLALLHRYRNRREGTRFEELYDLLTQEDQHEAEVLGKAMRFGAMLWMEAGADLGKLSHDAQTGQLKLVLPEKARPLYGEVAEARLNSLAAALSAETDVSFV